MWGASRCWMTCLWRWSPGRPRRRLAPFRHPPLQEPLQDHDRPERPGVIGATGAVLREQAADLGGGEESLAFEALRGEQAVDLRPQAAVDPAGDRDREPPL